MLDDTTQNAMRILLELIAIDSPSTKEHAITAYLASQLENRGFATSIDTSGNLLATRSGTNGREHERPVLLNCHMDTVPSAVNVKPVITETTITSDGTTALGTDDKGALAAVLAALDWIASTTTPYRPLVLLFTVSEEVALAGAREFDTSLLPEISAGYTLDASGSIGTVVTQAPWKSEACIVFTGQSAHAGFCPESGISAITLAAEAVHAMQLGRLDSETTANIGSIHGGGNTNIVCDRVTMQLEVRSLVKQKVAICLGQIESCCQQAISLHGGSYRMESIELYPGYTVEADDPVLATVEAACHDLGFPFSYITPGGGSDANILRAAGIPIVVLSSGYEHPHTEFETMDIAELGNLVKLIVALVSPRMEKAS